MPFDPEAPAFQSPNSSEAMRAQLNALKELIDAIPDGPPGPQGPQGEPGPQGAMGDVTVAQLNQAIAGSSANSNAIATLDVPFADPDAETLRQAFNTLVLALRR